MSEPEECAAPRQGGRPETAEDQALIELAHQVCDLARQGDTDRLVAYLDVGAPVDLTDPSGNTLLMLAAYHGHAELVRDLSQRGADVNRLNDRGQSPLAGAVFKGYREVVSTLLRHGADPDAGEPSARATAEMFGRPDLLRG